MFSSRATLVAVLLAFASGLLASLAVRPTGSLASTDTAEAQERQSVHWRMPLYSSRNLAGSGPTIVWMENAIQEATNGDFVLDMYEPGEMVPPFAITEAVGAGKVEAGWTWIGYDQGSIPSAALFAAVPFGLEPTAYISWWYYGGGHLLAEEIYAEHNVFPILCGLSGPETAGWFREPIESLSDVEGLKIRFAGIGGKVMQKLGASITMLPAGEIFQALETGVIDATEYSQPITDRALGFSRIANYNYFPGWHQPFSASHVLVNLDVWNATSKANKALLKNTCTAAMIRSFSLTESLQGPVLAEFEQDGIKAVTLPLELLKQLKAASAEVLSAEGEKNADFKRVYESQTRFRATYNKWRDLAYLPAEVR